jgi:proteasome regulatory subunit
MLDRAILRPGRFDRLIEVPNPNEEARQKILDIHTRDMSLADDVDFEDLAKQTEGKSGADIESLTTEAGMFAIRDGRTEVRQADFDDALDKLGEEEETGIVTSGSLPSYAY